MLKTPPTTILRDLPAKYLPLLRIIGQNKTTVVCVQHTHDLSALSRFFFSVVISPGVTHEIAADSIRFDDSNSSSSRALVAELKEHVNRVLSRVRVSHLYSHQASYTIFWLKSRTSVTD